MTGGEGVNVPLLRKAVEWAEAEAAKPAIDREWRQAAWVSDPRRVAFSLLEDTPAEYDGTEWAVVQALAPHCGTAYCIAGWVGQSLDPSYAKDHLGDGGIHVESFATEALGLTMKQADLLFDSENSIEDVRRIAEDIAGERL